MPAEGLKSVTACRVKIFCIGLVEGQVMNADEPRIKQVDLPSDGLVVQTHDRDLCPARLGQFGKQLGKETPFAAN